MGGRHVALSPQPDVATFLAPGFEVSIFGRNSQEEPNLRPRQDYSAARTPTGL
jgi:hypothetical protein